MEIDTASSRITFGGLATGLDTSSLLEGLLEVERLPLKRLEGQREDLEAEQELFRDLNSLLLDVRNAALALDNQDDLTQSGPSLDEEFLSYVGSSSDESVVIATANGSASPGTYSVRVDALATVGRDISAAFADKTTAFGGAGDTFSVDFGGAAPITVAVPVGGTSLDALRSAINASPENAGNVRAEILYDGASYRLIVSGTQTGAANDIAITTTLTDAGGSPFVDAALVQNAEDARLNVLGIDITRASNQVSDAIAGVTLDLRSAPVSGAIVTVTVSRDDEAIADRIETLIDAVNALREFSIEQSAIDPTTDRAGPLSGEPLLRSIESIVFSNLTDRFDFAGNSFDSLGFIGVSTGEDGLLSLDRAVLSEKLAIDAVGVRELFSGDGTTDGAAAGLARALKPIVRSGDGALALRDDSFGRRISILDVSIERFEARLAQREEALIARFSALESLVSRLQTQSGFLEGLGIDRSSRN